MQLFTRSLVNFTVQRVPNRDLQNVIKVIVGDGLVDEIDAIAGKRESAQHDMGRRIVAQMLTCMDDLAQEPPQQRSDSLGDKPTQPPDTTAPAKGHVFVIGVIFPRMSLQ